MRWYVTKGIVGRLPQGRRGTRREKGFFLKKTLYLIAAFLFMLSLGSVSASLDDQPQGVFQNGYEWTDRRSDVSDISWPNGRGPDRKSGTSHARPARSLPSLKSGRELVRLRASQQTTANGKRLTCENTLAHGTLPLGTRVSSSTPPTAGPPKGSSTTGACQGRQVDILCEARQLVSSKGVLKLKGKRWVAENRPKELTATPRPSITPRPQACVARPRPLPRGSKMTGKTAFYGTISAA